MIASIGFTILKWLVIICVVIFILYNFFTDPVGSAQFVADIVNGIIDGIKAIITFVTTLSANTGG